MEKMEVEVVDQPDQEKEKQIDQQQHHHQENEKEAEDSERGRPSTPKWWRPSHPPETYKWEEVRRQRQKGGYPWTHLDKDEEIDVDDYLDDNLYEPVNPPPLYGNESYLSKDLQQVPQAEERMIDIPPEHEILTSEGLDGLDKPDPHDNGFDGEREWQNLTSDDEQGHQNRSAFTAGIRSKSGERPRSTTPKSVGFSPDTVSHEIPDEPDQEVPSDMQTDPEPTTSGGGGGSHRPRQTAFDILKSKAGGAVDQVKQRIKSAIPVRPKISAAKMKRRRKTKQEQGDDGEELPEDAEMKEGEEGEEPAEQTAAEQSEEPMEVCAAEPSSEEAGLEGKSQDDEEKKKKKAEEEEKKKKEKEEKERKKADEKAAKAKAEEEKKKAKLEEKLAKAREAEEQRQAKAEEERKKKEEEEVKKAAEKAAKEEEARKAAEAKKEEEARKAAEKAAKEEEARKAAEAKKEEEAKKAAEKAAKAEEAKKAAEAKKAEEEAKKAAEKTAKEEAKKLADAQKEEERKAAEAAAAEKAAEKAAAAEEAVSKVEEQVQEQSMDTTEEKVVVEGEAAEGGNEEEGEEPMDVVRPHTPSGTTKRRYIKQRRNPLAEIPNPITALRNQVEDFKNKLKRSRTPPRRQVQRKQRRSRSADASRSPPREPGDEEEGEAEQGESAEMETKGEEESEECTNVEASKSEEGSVQGSAADDEQQSEGKPATGTLTKKRRQPAAKEKLDKLGAQLKGLGAKSIGIASQATKEVGQKMKGVGKDLQKLGSKVNEKVGEIKATKERSKSKSAEAIQIEETPEEVVVAVPAAPPEPEAPPKRTFRFKRRGESQDEADEEEMERDEQEHFYENAQVGGAGRQRQGDDFERNRLLGRADRDWESPLDRQQSREGSEERLSAKISSRSSPPGSSLASSTVGQPVRRPGVLEEIDSDEFFLRERGISEGEDEEEVNRFLVEELRQAFRPTMSNALAGFDMDRPEPSERSPRKPPRKDKEVVASPTSYQTFPPERPKRKQPQGYVSKFMKEHEGEDEEYMGSNEEVRGSTGDMMKEEDLFESEEGIQEVKEKLSAIEQEELEASSAEPPRTSSQDQYEDDGRYEPINDGPTKPTRMKKKQQQPKRPPTPPSFYYNTIAANEWLQELEQQIDSTEPAAPVRTRRGSGKSGQSGTSGRSVPEEGQQAAAAVAEPPVVASREQVQAPSPQAENVEEVSRPASQGAAGVDDYVDEAGYAIVQKDREQPRTMPRKKKKRAAEGESQQPQEPSAAFFSLPRFAGQSAPVVPPQRPNRMYSSLRPKRPPRSKSGSRSGSNQNLEKESPLPRREVPESRPSASIGIMQGRPLPPPPRPTRSPAPPLNDLDQSSIETALGIRHYANFEDMEPHQVEELFSATNIPVLGPRAVPPPRVTEVDMACQTDPVPDDEFILGLSAPESPVLDSSRIRTASSGLEGHETQTGESPSIPPRRATATGDVSSSFQQTPRPQSQTSNTSQPPETHAPPHSPLPFVFPTRLHLEQLEVDFLRVNDLSAQSIRVEHLQTSQLEVNSMNATGPLSVSKIQTHSLNSDEVTCNRLSSEKVDLPSVPPPSFYQLSCPDDESGKPGSEQELCLKTEEKEEKENESACPPEFSESVQNLMGYVDSTNDYKSSHVAEKIVDKQLNVTGSSPNSGQSKPMKKDASVGTRSAAMSPPSPLQANVPQQLNNLNQESSKKEEGQPGEIQVRQQFLVTRAPVASPAQPIPSSSIIDAEPAGEQQAEEVVVRGSYTLPYSYMAPQSSTSLTRTGSVKTGQPRSDSTPKSPSSTLTRDVEPLGQTVAQGEVLNVKFSIPVERGSTGQSNAGPRPPPRPHQASSSTRLPDSASSQAEPAKKDAPTKQAPPPPPKEVKPAPAASEAPVASGPPVTPSQAVATDRRPSVSEEGMFNISMRLGRAVLRFTMRALQSMADYIDTAAPGDPAKAEQQRANMQVLLCLLLVLVVGLILATARTAPYITPRWEFLMPPPDL